MLKNKIVAAGNFIIGILGSLLLLWFIFLYYPGATLFYEEEGLANFTVQRAILVLALLLSVSNFYSGFKNFRRGGNFTLGILLILMTIIVAFFSIVFALNSIYNVSVEF